MFEFIYKYIISIVRLKSKTLFQVYELTLQILFYRFHNSLETINDIIKYFNISLKSPINMSKIYMQNLT